MGTTIIPDFELQNLNRDLERLGSQTQSTTRKRTWYRNLLQDSQKPGIVCPGDARSVRTTNSVFGGLSSTFSVLVKWASPQSQSSSRIKSSSGLLPQHIALVFLLTKVRTVDQSENFLKASVWYSSYLECKIKAAWVTLFKPVLVDINTSFKFPSGSDIAIAFEFLAAVVELFRDTKELALIEIVDALYNKGLFRDTDVNRSAATQLVFASIGWLSALYIPQTKPEKNFLQITDHLSSEPAILAKSRYHRYKSKTFTSYSQTLENKDQALWVLLGAFGEIMPKRAKDSTQQECPHCSGRHDSSKIDISLVSFHTLNKVSFITIEWVECLSLHLEFDSRTKVLKLFRFPSLCFLLYRNHKDMETHKEVASLMSQIFHDSKKSYDSATAEIDEAAEYFKEVLLTYRLIFGQNRNSHREFSKLFPTWAKSWSHAPADQITEDPLLSQICGHHCESEEVRAIFDEIGAEDLSNHYTSNIDFPFLGKRLEILQTYVKGHRPKNLWGLWNDDRDMGFWWTFWAVIIIGGSTLLVAIVGLAFQMWQAFLSQQQVLLALRALEQPVNPG